MRAVFVIILTMTAASAAELKVDHATIACRNLAETRKLFAAVGLPMEYGGKHANGVTEMALASFPDGSYLELIAPQPGADASRHYWGKFMNGQVGPCAWAVTTKDLAGDMKRLESAHIPTELEKNGRARPDGVQLKWQISRVGPPPQGSLFPFLIQDDTPRELRVYPEGKPTLPEIGGVVYVVVEVKDLAAAVGKYRAAFGLPEPQFQEDREFGARLAWFPGSPVVLAGPLNESSWLALRLKQDGEIPCAFVLSSNRPVKAASTQWFSRKLHWLDPEKLGMRIGLAE
jgi:catechol 2,3-dioxygenase-like lactoylglutathione lyase family enzyme